MNNHLGLSDQVRKVALEQFVHPAIEAGKTQFSVAARDVMQILRTYGFPVNNWPQVCTAIQTEKFLRANGLEIEGVEGPPSGTSSTVVVRYRVVQPHDQSLTGVVIRENPSNASANPSMEDRTERALQAAERLRGLLKKEIAEFGGAEAFMRWVRSEDGNAA